MLNHLIFLETAITSEKINKWKSMLEDLGYDGLEILKKLIIAILIIVVGKKAIKIITKLLEKYFTRIKVEVSVAGFLVAFIRALLYVILITIIVVDIVGIESSSIVALVGSAGLSIGLALQGGLSNFAGGVLILLLKPFRVGDYIISDGYEGTVTAIDIFYTKLLTFDNKLLVMPNGQLSNSNIINVTNEPIRRLDINVLIGYTENIDKVKSILYDIAHGNSKVLTDQEIKVFVSNFETSGISMGMRTWVIKDDYWILKWELLEQIKNAFDSNSIHISYNHLDVNIKSNQEEIIKSNNKI